MAGDRNYQDPDWLRKQYVNKGKSGYQIADKCGVTSGTIYRWLRKFDIERQGPDRTPSVYEDGSGRLYTDESWLRKQYIELKKSSPEIAADCDTANSVIYRWLEKFDIDRRGHGKAASLSHNGPPDEQYTSETWLREQYLQERRSGTEIAAECDVSKQIIYKWLSRFSIQRRSREEAQESSPRYKGGVRRDYGEGWSEKKRQSARSRDDNLCQGCGLSSDGCIERFGCDLHVHHVIPADHFSDSQQRNALSNLVSLCPSCHQTWEQIPGLRPELTA